MKRKAYGLIWSLLLGLVGCDGASGPALAVAPALGKADGGDRADRQCRVVLRTLASGQGALDLAVGLFAQGAEAAVLYRDGAGAWREVAASPELQVAAYQRFAFTLPADAVEVAPFARTQAGRLFDHNRNPGDLDNYGPTVAPAPEVCPVAQPAAALTFAADYSETLEGTLAPGGRLELRYALERLPRCRYSRAGYQLWDIEAALRWLPSGDVERHAVTRVAQGTRVSVPVDVTVPSNARGVEIWFRNYEAQNQCEDWDSDWGRNYRFAW